MINIGNRLEPLWDYYLVDREKTTANLSVNPPQKMGNVFEHKNPFGREMFYPVILKDGDIYRMYYSTGFRYKNPETGKFDESKIVTCYAESVDGIRWTFPALGIYGDNNCILMDPKVPMTGMCVFKDTNPACPADMRYKGILRIASGEKPFLEDGVLACFVSEDGIHFRRIEDILQEPGKFDSLNVVFWDAIDNEYKLYYRDFEGWQRRIHLMTSPDFVNWMKHGMLRFDDEEQFQLYTNNISRYSRAPHVFIGLPVRYIERSQEWTPSFEVLPDLESRKWRFSMHHRYAFALTDTVFMVSRDGVHWHKFNEAIADAGPEAPRTWKYGDTYFNYGFVEDDTTISCYAADSAWDGDFTALCRYTFRRDGFASFKSGWDESVITTKPFICTGEKMYLNFRTSAAGAIRIRLTDESGNVNDSCEIFGNAVHREIVFDKPIGSFTEKPIQMEIRMRDAEVFSFQFC